MEKLSAPRCAALRLALRLTFSSRSSRLMRSPIMRRSSSICVSPGPPRRPMPPAGAPGGSSGAPGACQVLQRASSTCSLPSWLRARWAKMSRISAVRSATGTPSMALQIALLRRAQAWSNMTPVPRALEASRA
jgi:hypothetical protein